MIDPHQFVFDIACPGIGGQQVQRPATEDAVVGREPAPRLGHVAEHPLGLARDPGDAQYPRDGRESLQKQPLGA